MKNKIQEYKDLCIDSLRIDSEDNSNRIIELERLFLKEGIYEEVEEEIAELRKNIFENIIPKIIKEACSFILNWEENENKHEEIALLREKIRKYDKDYIIRGFIVEELLKNQDFLKKDEKQRINVILHVACLDENI